MRPVHISSAAIALLLTLGLAALFAPTSAQTDPLPESTPEFWPLAFDPATVEVNPDAFTLVFKTPFRCLISPDSTVAAVSGLGLYNTITGERYTGIEGNALAFSPVAPLVQIQNEGVYNYETGEKQVSTDYPKAGLFSPDGRWFIDYNTVYDLQTGEVVTQIERSGDGINRFSGARFTEDGTQFTYHAEIGMHWLDTSTWQSPYDPAIFDELMSREGAFQFSYEMVLIENDGIYNLLTGEKIISLDTDEFLLRITDSVYIVMNDGGDIVLYNSADGSERQRIKMNGPVEWPYQVRVSSDNRTLIVPQFTEVRHNGQSSYTPISALIFDIDSGQQRAVISPMEGEVWPLFSNPRYATVHNQGLYDLETGQLLLPLSNSDHFSYKTLSSGNIGIVSHSSGFNGFTSFTVFDAETWLPRFSGEGNLTVISPDGRWFVGSGTGIYDATGVLIQPMPERNLYFNATATLLISTNDCAIYRAPEMTE